MFCRGKVSLHYNQPAVFVAGAAANEIWVFDDNNPEVFTLPADLTKPVAAGNLGSWRTWSAATPPIYTGGGSGMCLFGKKIYVFGGENPAAANR